MLDRHPKLSIQTNNNSAVADFPRTTIFVVDDENANLEVISLLLSKESYQLHNFSEATSVLHTIEHIMPDIILLDVMMPGIDGIELCHRLKRDPQTKHIPIIMVSALNSKQDLANCLEAGADDFIGKPLNGLELRARVRSLLRIKRQHDDLQRLLQLREEALQLREDLSNMVIHDLRNPLANIMLSCQIMRLYELDQRTVKKVDHIEYSSNRLATMIDSLLIMAKLEAGKLLIQPTTIAVEELVKSTIADFQTMADQQSIFLQAELASESTAVFADLVLLRRVLDNLLSNALKFAPTYSAVVIAVQQESGNCLIEIKDQGSGVSPELREQIFSKFEIGEHMPKIQQMGLGLAFCKLAIEAHGGRIEVLDNQPQGCIFRITLTACADASTTIAIAPEDTTVMQAELVF
jgi:two-component system, sensor histidine kinase and response regulator